jgi:threonine synthase
MAGGALITRLAKGFGEVAAAGFADGSLPQLFGAQASGCSPIVNTLERAGSRIEPVIPRTIARSIAIGNPADGALAVQAIRQSGGWAAAVDDAAIVAGIRLLAETTGIFTETAGGATVSAARALVMAGRLRADAEVVLCITGNGLKTVEAVQPVLPEAPIVLPRLREVIALVNGAAAHT